MRFYHIIHIMPPQIPLLMLLVLSVSVLLPPGTGRQQGSALAEENNTAIGLAVEFTNHAAAAYIAEEMGWFAEAGLDITTYESYATGMALAAALNRGDINAAFICLVPAINARANAGVPIRVVAGTHRHGYGLVVNEEKISEISDLAASGIRIGCVREGGAVDVLLNRVIDTYDLERPVILSRVRRMNPENQMLALVTGRLEAAFMPEQWATMAEAAGFKMLLTSKDVWPGMQGSVLVVKEELLKDSPDTVQRLIGVARRATAFINQKPRRAAEIVAARLRADGAGSLPIIPEQEYARLSADIMLRSMERMEYSLEINPESVDKTIAYMAELGYLKHRLPASEILDLRFIADAPDQ